MRIIHFIYLQTCLSAVMAVYIKEYMNIIEPQIPLNNNSFYGYSIAYFDKQLFISAPAADNIGHIYSYNIISDIVKKIYYISIPRLNNDKTDYWMGASIKAGPTFLVICAPRTVSQPYRVPVTVGTCFKLSRQDDKAIVKKLPDLADADKRSNGGMNSYGWSIEVDLHGRVLVGGPAVVKDKNSGVEIFYNDDISPTLVNTTDIINLGYSIVSGNFLTNTEVTYAVSTTYGEHGEGEILFFDEKVKYINVLDHGEVGSMYGAVLCAARLGHTRTSLLVGAPTFASNGQYNTGAVYLYLPVNKTEILLDRIIKGTVDGGHFGSAIANLGDLDGDSKEDFAIGAPYEGLGAVYIYTGSGLLSGQTWWRKIQPEKFFSFGFSLVSLPHIYEKGCNDLAVGAPLSNHVLILKCIPVTTIEIYTKFPILQNRSNQTFFQFSICHKFISYPTNPKFVTSKLRIHVQMIHSAATLEKKSYDISTTMKKCQTSNVLTPIKGNYDELLKFNFTAVVETPKGEVPDIVLSDRSIISLQHSVWAANCRLMYGHCLPRLKAEPSSSFSIPYKVGLQKTEQLSLVIENSGEIAYDACTVVWLPRALMKHIPPGCTRDAITQRVVCKPSEPIPSGSKWQTGNIEIDTTSLTNKDESIDIHYDIYGHCGNETEKQSSKLSFPLVFGFDGIVISGVSSPSKVLNVSIEDVSSGKQFHHIYTVINKGPIDLVDVKCKILLSDRSYVEYNTPTVIQTKGNLTSTQLCVLNEEGQSGDMTCNIGELLKASEIVILLPIHFLPNTFSNILNENRTINTGLSLEILSNTSKVLYSTAASARTLLEPQTTSVPVWISIIAFLIALFILIIIVLVLRECGFLKRKNKTNLERLKNSIHSRHRRGSQNVSLCPEPEEQE